MAFLIRLTTESKWKRTAKLAGHQTVSHQNWHQVARTSTLEVSLTCYASCLFVLFVFDTEMTQKPHLQARPFCCTVISRLQKPSGRLMDAQPAPSLGVLKIKLVLSPPKPASALLPSASVYGPT